MLQCPPFPSRQEVLDAYKVCSLRYHPDKVTDRTPENLEDAHNKMAAVLEARRVLLEEVSARLSSDTARENRSAYERSRNLRHGGSVDYSGLTIAQPVVVPDVSRMGTAFGVVSFSAQSAPTDVPAARPRSY